MNDLKKLFGYFGSYKKDLLIGSVLVIAETAFELVRPALMADIIDVGVKNYDVSFILEKGVQMGKSALSFPCLPVFSMPDMQPGQLMDTGSKCAGSRV